MTPLEIGSWEAQAIVRMGRALEAVEADFERLDRVVLAFESAKWPHNYRQLRRLGMVAAEVGVNTQELVQLVAQIRAERDCGYEQGKLL